METGSGLFMTFTKIVALADDQFAAGILREFAHPDRIAGRCTKYEKSRFGEFRTADHGDISQGLLIRNPDPATGETPHERPVDVWIVKKLADLENIGDSDTMFVTTGKPRKRMQGSASLTFTSSLMQPSPMWTKGYVCQVRDRGSENMRHIVSLLYCFEPDRRPVLR